MQINANTACQFALDPNQNLRPGETGEDGILARLVNSGSPLSGKSTNRLSTVRAQAVGRRSSIRPIFPIVPAKAMYDFVQSRWNRPYPHSVGEAGVPATSGVSHPKKGELLQRSCSRNIDQDCQPERGFRCSNLSTAASAHMMTERRVQDNERQRRSGAGGRARGRG